MGVCRVHYARNLLATVPRASTEMVAAAFRTVFAQLTPAEVDHRYDEVADQLAEAARRPEEHGAPTASVPWRARMHTRRVGAVGRRWSSFGWIAVPQSSRLV